MKKLSINQFDCEHEYKQAKKQLKKSSLDQRILRGSRILRTNRSLHGSGTGVPEDLEVMLYDGVGSNNPNAYSTTE